MPASKTEQVLEALKALPETVPGATVERNSGDGAPPGGRTVFPGVDALSGASERGKRGRALCRWHFQPGGGPEYRRACRDDDLPCARGDAGADGQRCPCREHALIRRQEHEAWEVLLACKGQLRLARGAT
jgi:hypothetical protein